MSEPKTAFVFVWCCVNKAKVKKTTAKVSAEEYVT